MDTTNSSGTILATSTIPVPAGRISIAALRSIRVFATVGLGLSLHLLYGSWSATGTVGCGGAGGCAAVLGSRWAKWLGIPVSAPAAMIYLAMLAATWLLDERRSQSTRRRAMAMLMGGAALLGGAAIWFVGLQLAIVEHLCPYCLAAHACGFIVAGMVMSIVRSHALPPAWYSPMLAAAGSLALLIVGQILVHPATYEVDVADATSGESCPTERAVVTNTPQPSESRPDEAAAPAIGLPPEDNAMQPAAPPWIKANSYATQASYDAPSPRQQVPLDPGVQSTNTFDSKISPKAVAPAAPTIASFHLPGAWFDLSPLKVPCIGSTSAPHYLLMISDYACPHCRASHHVVSQTLRRYGDQISLLVLPMPLDRRCNPQLSETEGAPEPQDCALNRLALAVWCADSAAYGQFDAWLFAADRSRSEAEARDYAAALVGQQSLEQAEGDRRIDAILKLDTQLYARAKGGALPKLLLGSTLISGLIEDSQPLDAAIEQEWHLRPAR